MVEAAEEEPEEYGHLVEQMDRSGKVAGAYRRLDGSEASQGTGSRAARLADRPVSSDRGRPAVAVRELATDLPYPTMAFEEIKAMPVRDIADENAILWLWTTNAHLRVAFEVVEAWGFEYKTLLTWVKDRMGTGEWLRGQTEHCILSCAGKAGFRKWRTRRPR